MTPHSLSPDWAVSRMEIITKYDDPILLDAVMELLAGVYDTRGDKGDCAQAALEYGYRKTADCQKHCDDYLSIAV